ncbi:MAG: alpha/beta fold hydrolase [Ectothiorhodospiraceae bacterium]|nr:alpha/beta fold hydrolase [Ectothiorhodospiraceae bacterium]
MATFVISHGAWGGGWEWTPVADGLRERGHRVYTPTLTGLGERAHLGDSRTGLSEHVEDLLAVFRYEDLHDVILCGHSYSGMVVTGVADRIPERIRLLVYLDAFVPENGQALGGLLPQPFIDALLQTASERDDNRGPIPPDLLPPEGVIPAETRQRYIRRLCPHPMASFTEPVSLSGAIADLPRAYVRCTGEVDPETDILGPFAARARADGWLYRELETAHDLQLTDPGGTLAMLDDLASVAGHSGRVNRIASGS